MRKPVLLLAAALTAITLTATPAMAQKKSIDTRIEKKKSAPAENPSAASARKKVKENTRASLGKLKSDVAKNGKRR